VEFTHGSPRQQHKFDLAFSLSPHKNRSRMFTVRISKSPVECLTKELDTRKCECLQTYIRNARVLLYSEWFLAHF